MHHHYVNHLKRHTLNTWWSPCAYSHLPQTCMLRLLYGYLEQPSAIDNNRMYSCHTITGSAHLGCVYATSFYYYPAFARLTQLIKSLRERSFGYQNFHYTGVFLPGMSKEHRGILEWCSGIVLVQKDWKSWANCIQGCANAIAEAAQYSNYIWSVNPCDGVSNHFHTLSDETTTWLWCATQLNMTRLSVHEFVL